MSKKPQRIGILTAGSDSPGLNAAIRAIGKAAQGRYGMELVFFQDGFRGLLDETILQPSLSGILTVGGTILGTSREAPLDGSGEVLVNGQPANFIEACAATYARQKLDVLVCLGGRETQESAFHLMQHGLRVITLPKGIDNDLAMTDTTIGFDTALGTATEAIDRLHSTAHSHHRIIIIEIMGRNTGWLTLGSGIAGGADVILLPEIPYDVRKVAQAIQARNQSGRRFSIVAVSEGAISQDTVEFFDRSKKVNRQNRQGEARALVDQQLEKIEERLPGSTIYLSNRLEKYTGLETRITILGHLLRGGMPSAADRVLATNLGAACVGLIHDGAAGIMVAQQGGAVTPVPLEQVIGKHKHIPADHPWLVNARNVGTSLGE